MKGSAWRNVTLSFNYIRNLEGRGHKLPFKCFKCDIELKKDETVLRHVSGCTHKINKMYCIPCSLRIWI